VNDYFESPDGGLYLIAAVEDGDSLVNVELTVVWMTGRIPAVNVWIGSPTTYVLPPRVMATAAITTPKPTSRTSVIRTTVAPCR
jgi:hypothetical protein